MSSDNDKPTPFASDNPLSLVRPSWSDPTFQFASSYTTQRAVTITPGTPTQLCVADPRRWAVSFVVGSVVPAITPGRSTSGRGLWFAGLTTVGLRLSLSLLADGPLVSGELWALSSGGTVIDVVETIIQ